MMARLLLLAAVVLVLAGCGGGDDAAGPTPAGPSSPPPAEPLLAAASDPAGSRLSRVSGRTLEPVEGRSVSIPFAVGVAERSPDGGSVAVGDAEGGTVELVDVERMRALGTIDVGPAPFVEKLHWVRRDLLSPRGRRSLPRRRARPSDAAGAVRAKPRRHHVVLRARRQLPRAPRRAVPRHRLRAAGRLRRQRAPNGGAAGDQSRLGRGGRLERGLQGSAVGSCPRSRAVGCPSARPPSRRPGGRGRPCQHERPLSRSQRARFAPRTAARLARAGGAREDAPRPRPKTRSGCRRGWSPSAARSTQPRVIRST
jgi:hypothetical protein